MKKGLILVPMIIGFQVAFAAIALVAMYHIPAWERAKDARCEAAYQAGNMTCGDVKK